MRFPGTVLWMGRIWALPLFLAGCVTDQPYMIEPPPPYMILPVDESMSCSAIAGSFRFSVRRAARLEYWLAAGPLAGYDSDRFPLDAPKQLADERRRLDALTDLQRIKGCTVIEPGPAVVEERERLEESARNSRPQSVLRSKG
ncbi:hypothetical protein JQ580_26600 [Bradyrhizobium japonicum]|uniref:hypothetical protein n=1 Tax=Bradyrhizobium japonicum TaxID=375 RepID=UPI001BAE3300|nr:hypothetical protein [Bradyrhizobium japonicum]MBR0994297.1 hypothetical protein [Bradyrhizobium japonicum]